MCTGTTELAFHAWSRIGEKETVPLGSFVTAPYEKIRVLVLGPQGAPPGEAGEVEVTLSFGEDQGTPGPLDRFLVGPYASVTLTYDVPGLMIGVAARAPSSASDVDVYVWGRRGAGDGMIINPVPAAAETSTPSATSAISATSATSATA